jgi:hypothetical protein
MNAPIVNISQPSSQLAEKCSLVALCFAGAGSPVVDPDSIQVSIERKSNGGWSSPDPVFGPAHATYSGYNVELTNYTISGATILVFLLVIDIDPTIRDTNVRLTVSAQNADGTTATVSNPLNFGLWPDNIAHVINDLPVDASTVDDPLSSISFDFITLDGLMLNFPDFYVSVDNGAGPAFAILGGVDQPGFSSVLTQFGDFGFHVDITLSPPMSDPGGTITVNAFGTNNGFQYGSKTWSFSIASNNPPPASGPTFDAAHPIGGVGSELRKIRCYFSRAMDPSSGLLDPGLWSVTRDDAGAAPSVVSVTADAPSASPSSVVLELDADLVPGVRYHATVTSA